MNKPLSVGDPVRPVGEFIGEGPRGKLIQITDKLGRVEYTHGHFPDGSPIITYGWHELEGLLKDDTKGKRGRAK